MISSDEGLQKRLPPGSFVVVSSAAVRDGELGDAPFRTLAALSRYRNGRTGRAYPSTARIARELGISQRAVQKHLATLKALGYLRDEADPAAPRRRSRTFTFDFGNK